MILFIALFISEQAETAAKKELFEKRFGVEEKGTALLSEFLDEVYLPWSKLTKSPGAMTSTCSQC